MAPLTDPLPLLQDLIRCPSITPADAGALDVLQTALTALGFHCQRLPFGTVDNLYARRGTAGPHLCFAGHTDVVPSGPEDAWRYPPFAATVAEDAVWGRGAADMKGGIAAFVAAVAREMPAQGTVSLLITGDEEGPAINGTVKVLEWMRAQGEQPDWCVVGEPSCHTAVGDTIKIGRRGSLNGHLVVTGRQGHSAYPHLADNPLPRLCRMLTALTETPLDQGSAHFQASTLALTSIDVGNPATNVTPARGEARFNIRFNDHHDAAGIVAWLRQRLGEEEYHLETECSGDSFLTPPGPLSDALGAAVTAVTGRTAALDTGGGTSDARFIKDLCPVAEFGVLNRTIHRTDEHVPLADLETLTRVYAGTLRRLLGEGPPC